MPDGARAQNELTHQIQEKLAEATKKVEDDAATAPRTPPAAEVPPVWRTSRPRLHSSSSCRTLRCQSVAQFLAWLERSGPTSCNLDGFTRLRIPSLASLLIFHCEAAKPAKVNAFAGSQCLADLS